MLALCTAILVAAALYLGRSIFAPVAFSLFALAIVWPFQGALQTKIPKLVALVFTLLLTLIVFAMLGLAIAWGSGQVGHWLLSNVDRFQFVYTKTTEWLEGHGIFVTGMVADRFDVTWLVRFVQHWRSAQPMSQMGHKHRRQPRPSVHALPLRSDIVAKVPNCPALIFLL